MSYCPTCGTQHIEKAVVCPNCGCALSADFAPAAAPAQKRNSGLATAAKVLMIVDTVLCGILTYGIALAWCLPMTLSYCKKLRNNEPVSTGFKVCSLIFVSLVGGILMLCDHED